MKFVLQRRPEQIEKNEMTLARHMYDRLSNIKKVKLYTKKPDSKSFVPVISFNIDGYDSERIAVILNDRFNIAVRAGLHCAPLAHGFFHTEETGTVRAVMSVFSTQSQVEYFANAVHRISHYKNPSKKVAIDI